MITIAKADSTEREVLFGNAADRAGISNPAIVEIDRMTVKTIPTLENEYGSRTE